MKSNILTTAAILLAAIALGGCNMLHHGDEKDAPKSYAVATLAPSRAAASQPSWGQPAGKVTFTQSGDKVKVVANLTGVPPGKHGFHIHQKGDLSAPDLTSAGDHFNPGGHPHGGPTTSPVHEGDLGNITADAAGNAKLELTVTDISIGTGAANDIVGKSVILHAKPDDFSTQKPPGNAGPRIAGGVIEQTKELPKKKEGEE